MLHSFDVSTRWAGPVAGARVATVGRRAKNADDLGLGSAPYLPKAILGTAYALATDQPLRRGADHHSWRRQDLVDPAAAQADVAGITATD